MEEIIKYLQQVKKIPGGTAVLEPENVQKVIDFYNQHQWTKNKPDFPCVVVSRTKQHDGTYEYELHILDWVDAMHADEKYLGWMNTNGQELGDLESDLEADEYFVIEKLVE